MTRSHWQRGDAGATVHCDIAIVGGGINGVSVAYWLKKHNPRLRVAIVESRKLGHGASGRNAGFLLQGAAVDFVSDIARYGKEKAHLLWQFTQENRALIASELDAGKIQLKAGGSVLLAGTDEENERLKSSADLLTAMGEVVTHWGLNEIDQKLKGTGFRGGLHISTGARVHSINLVREIAGRSGSMILEGHPVIDVEKTAEGILLRTAMRNVIADRVVMCLNAYLPHLLPQTSAYIRPVRAQMLATTPLPKWLNYPVYSHDGYYYIRQLSSGTVLLGGARHLFAEEEIGYEDRTTAHLQQALMDYMSRHFPHTGAAVSQFSWSGVMGFTEDGLPIVSPLASLPGSYWVAGFNGHGMGYGFRFGKMVAGILNDDRSDEVYHNIFTIGRFEN